VAGGALGAKILFWLEDPQLTAHSLHNPEYLLGGKTIVGGLVFGLISVELTKRYIGLRDSTGDLYAIPLALGIAIGRIGCFLTGLSDNTYGTPTNLPWAINFGDGIPRHPTQLYEILFLLALIPILYSILHSIVAVQKEDCHFEGAGAKATASRETRFSSAPSRNQNWQPGDAFKLFMVAYLSFRLLCDFLKPYPRIFLGLGGIQWACVLILLYYSGDVLRWLRPSHSR
jgi:phosphatidylglycerol:prolipoprotein diacylglycerol transferase